MSERMYRPFKSADEFKPHRGRLLRSTKVAGAYLAVTCFTDAGVGCKPREWQQLFVDYVFDDTGEPCGVEVVLPTTEFAAGDWVTIKATGRLAQVCRVLQVGYYEIAFWKDVHRCLTPVHWFEIQKREGIAA